MLVLVYIRGMPRAGRYGRTIATVALAAVLLAALGRWVRAGREDESATNPERMRGVCWEASGRIGPEHLQALRDLGADWMSQTPFGWCPSLHSPEVILADQNHVWWGESDEGILETARWARELGIETLLKPHLWVRRGEWVGDVEMQSEADWERWFQGYERFILHYAEVAQRGGIEALAVGTELTRSTAHTAEWRRIIARVRQVYHGRLTYCANWHGESERIEFWDDLDFIGVQAYYPLATAGVTPAPQQMRAAWAPFVEALAALSKRTGKRIVFTEVGYKSLGGSLAEPWRWDLHGDADPDLQRDAYRSMFEAVWDRPWFGGTFIWKWHARQRASERAARDFTPQGKPALEVIRTYYKAGSGSAGSR